MTAIAGLVKKNGSPVGTDEIERMGAALNAHGRNGGGAWSKGAAGLTQRQSWVTPEDRQEHQPLVSEEPPGVLVSASRLHNRAELTEELGLDATQTREAPDSFFIWMAYLRWGGDCPRHLLGDYTFAIWDEQARRLLLAASPFSSQPLHYHDSPSIFAFATMPKGLFALAGVPREMDEEYVSKYLARVPRSPDATFYRGVRLLLPGQTLVLQSDSPVIRTFSEWEDENELRFSCDAEYEEAFLNLYTRVVRDHLRAAAPLGIMLSGGLDSASLAAVAAPLLGAENRRLAAYTEAPRAGFTLSPSSARYADEVERVQALACLYDNIDVTLLRPKGSHFLRDAGTYFEHTEVPFRNACNRPWIEAILGQAQTQGVQVLLMGSQGNGTISWKGETAREKAGRHPLRQAASRIKGYALSILAPSRPSLLRPEQAKRYGIETRRQNIGGRNAAPVGAARRCEMIRNTTAQSGSLWAGYQAMFGVEVRDPTADERIVRFCLALPPEQSYRDGISRRLIRRAMAGRLPAEILSGQRRGLQSADWRLTLLDAQAEMRAGLDRISRCDMAGRLLNLAGLRCALEELTRAGQGGDPMDIGLRNYLEHGLMTGRFLSWFETGE